MSEASPSSTVILLRDKIAGGIEVFMVKRSDRSSFVGGFYVFPGGRVEEQDALDVAQRLCDGADVAHKNLPGMPQTEAVAYHLAALRELYEEAGVLLVRNAAQRFISFEDVHLQQLFEGYRVASRHYQLPLFMVLEQENLRFALDALVPWSWWVTPEEERKRFDARFFLARFPEGQQAGHDEHETVYSLWITPSEALERYQAGTFQLVPPTLYTLHELAAYDSVEAVMAAAAQRPVRCMFPRAVIEGGSMSLVLPGGPGYPSVSGPDPLGITHYTFVDGKWQARTDGQLSSVGEDV